MMLTSSPSGRLAGMLLAAAVLAVPGVAHAADILWTGTAGDGNWNTGGNWMGGFVPEAGFEEVGIINNGDTVFIGAAAPDAAGLVMGQAAEDSGTLQILSGGSIDFVDSTGAPTGTANIGFDGTGTLDVRRGGSMSTTLLDVNVGSSVLIGFGAGPGFTSLTSTGGMFLGGTTRVRGAGHTFSAMGAVTFEDSGTYIAEVTSANTPLRTTGAANIDGDFRLEFGSGFTPSPGNAWNIVDAAAIVGAFDNVDLSAVPPAGPGTVYQLKNVVGGAHGQLLQLQLNRLLQLTVNTDTNAVSISSPSGSAISIDGYSILSDSGLLNTGQWNSLEDQSMAGWDEASPTSSAISELNFNVGGSLAVGASAVNLGTPYSTPVTFGQSPDIEFEYRTPTGEIVSGLVEYTGAAAANNLLLTVNPTTGEAQLRNSSNATLQLTGYSILSESGSLLATNGDWLSLEDQNVDNWAEATPTANALNELFGGVGATTLLPGQAYGLGNPFNEVSGSRDLELEFMLSGEFAPRLGSVHYGAIPDVPPPGDVAGDYNGNGIVDAADYTVWRNTFGASVTPGSGADGDGNGVVNQADYTFWITRFGNTSGAGAALAGAASVPEPASWSLVVAMAAVSCGAWKRRR